ncbi:hypothetical protein QNI19_38110 [Cytophagaceae bacterium DM2B3-1]|uniref:Chromosome partitioning protein ParB n=1 Tax=Xanthocytophaga flava TaxID=3048013 RepID=A0ABT7CYI9_9BACT|nr:hypothetical protein [Xanthocytophaga flavus]MDJ1498807.1 hypothetical protein [Xanthocytophaga flavus]
MAQSKTTIGPPPGKDSKVRKKPVLPVEEIQPSQNLHKESPSELVQLKFDVTADFRKEIKLYATERDMSMKELLEKMYAHYKNTNP